MKNYIIISGRVHNQRLVIRVSPWKWSRVVTLKRRCSRWALTNSCKTHQEEIFILKLKNIKPTEASNIINEVFHHIVEPKTRCLNWFPKYTKRETKKLFKSGRHLDSLVELARRFPPQLNHWSHKSQGGNLHPPENGVSLVTGISIIRRHGDGGLYLDLGEIHLKKEKGHLFAKVLKTITILDPQLIDVRLGWLKFSDGVGLYLVHSLAKGCQL